MDEFIEGIYLRELVAQCEFGVGSVQRMNKVLENHGSPSEFFREAGDFLQHSSAVSRLLWPPGGNSRQKKKRAKTRGGYLRKALEITDDHCLEDRTLRNHFEHFDERLDDWAETSLHKHMVDNNIGPRNALGNSIKDQDIMRWFDPATRMLIFRGEQFDVQALVDGLTNVQSKAQKRLETLEANRRKQRTPKSGAADAGS
jgi:hypothetical protein